MRTILFLIMFSSLSVNASQDEAYCTNIGKGEFKEIHEVCKSGDIIEVKGAQILTYCDFSKQIIESPIQEKTYACQYIGYNRKFRSRVDGNLSEWIVKE